MNRQTNYHEAETVNDPSFRTFPCVTSWGKIMLNTEKFRCILT